MNDLTVARIENIVIYLCTVGLILGLYYMSGSLHSLWGLTMILAVNSTSSKKEIKHDED